MLVRYDHGDRQLRNVFSSVLIPTTELLTLCQQGHHGHPHAVLDAGKYCEKSSKSKQASGILSPTDGGLGHLEVYRGIVVWVSRTIEKKCLYATWFLTTVRPKSSPIASVAHLLCHWTTEVGGSTKALTNDR